jgi:hypothetical protein
MDALLQPPPAKSGANPDRAKGRLTPITPPAQESGVGRKFTTKGTKNTKK